MRTSFDIQQEFDRIVNSKEHKKFNSNTYTMTLKMLEKLTLLSHERNMTQMLT
jgi:hypothetical protein